MIRGFIVPVFIVVVFIAISYFLFITAPELNPDAPVPIATTVRVQEVEPQNLRLQVHSQGTVRPRVESELIPEVSGRVSWISPNLVPGGYFNEGDVLLRVQPEDFENSRRRAQASLSRAQAEHELAKFEHDRMVDLFGRKMVSRSDMDSALRGLKVAEAALVDSRVGFSQADQDVGRTELIAPFTGLVRAESVDIGQFVSRGASIATIYASNQLEIRLPIADRQLAYLDLPITQRGELPLTEQPEVRLSTEYAGRDITWLGNIVRTEATIDSTSRVVYLVGRVSSDEQEIPLTVGLFVGADIEGRQVDNVVVLPRSALRDNNQVLVIDDDNRLHFRDVKPLRLYKDDVLIEAGLEAGELVCISPLQTAVDGMSVNPVFDAVSDRVVRSQAPVTETVLAPAAAVAVTGK